MTTRIGIDARKADDYGIGTYIRGLLEGLAKSAAESAHPWPEKFVVFHRTGSVLGDLGEKFELREENASGYSAAELVTLSRHAVRERLDLFHATHYVLPVALPCPAVVTIHDVLHLRFPENLKHPAAMVYADRMLRRALDARGVIAVSETTRTDLASAYQVDASRIDVIANGVGEQYFAALGEAEIASALARLGISRPYVLFVGNPKPHKNLGTLLEAFRRWHGVAGAGAPAVRLVLVGGQGDPATLRSAANSLGIGGIVDVMGHVAQAALPAIYQGAELLAFPSLYEGFGLPVLEAMASGTAVLAADTPAVREVAGDAAAFAPATDPQAWAVRLRELTGNSHTRAALAQAGRCRAVEFSWRRCAERTLAVYRRALHQHAEGRSDGVGAGDQRAAFERNIRPRRENDGGGFAWGAQLSRRGPK